MLHFTSLDPAALEVELLAVPVCENENIYEHPVLTAMAARLKKYGEFDGSKGSEILLYDPAEIKARRILFVGIGAAQGVDREVLRSACGRAVAAGMGKKLTQVAVAVPPAGKFPIGIEAVLEAMLEGGRLANHRFDAYRTKNRSSKKPLKRIDFLVTSEWASRFKSLPKKIDTICQGTLLARDWVNTPPNEKKPSQYAKMIAERAQKAGLKVQTLAKKQLQQKKFGAVLAVAAGSRAAPAMVILDHAPKGARKKVVFIGKGVTFDSGGLNLKPSKSLKGMKADMAGAAAVAAAMITVARLKLKTRVIGIVPLVENMVSGDATRPGDIIRTFSGKSVEIGNTDAEGRLILADALAYGIKQYKPDAVFDMATLTGACLMALGEGFAGVFSPDDPLAEAIARAAEKTHERCWRLPMPEDYKELLKSDLADINNMPSTRWGGAITAALFLSEFVNGTRWAHIDIAGPGFWKKGNDYCPAGGTGFGVRLLLDLLESLEDLL